ncbi:3-oxoacyl-ACP synthase III family protein [Glycomyces algeriensis]|uniref:3-oxoacyl-[acyl-carrier-protein] synthase 3 n=1 Tax=Glycomyces algeriensis TaxID=256037 RepID=A0A9W6GAL7_9ACTN|nr:beta-ketoacyl-ACP synthase III [Glycomyces algeriensis]MDA1368297.1 ketoacyl-ACP synthase III [Glycomyces algeriensis]MDR7351738.1 3-oxoacyl-[acyl-carrier-protein] synthase-3 [Glycomyces algeriensis]GLI44464.1 3-oxoacyl-[acyl-carrier-protein] synthase 3 [Glycomyces algeriensis]
MATHLSTSPTYTPDSRSAARRPVGVLGTGSYLPSRVVSNDEVAAKAGVDADWILRKTGIGARRYAAAGEATSDLAARAGTAALEDAGVDPATLDCIIVATSTPDHPQPATAAIVQHRIGADGVPAFDVNAVCTGFLFALAAAWRLVADGGRALVIGADIYSRIINPADRRTAVLFGDGAGAVVLGPVPDGRGITAAALRTHGAHHEMINVPVGGSRHPARLRDADDDAHYFAMDGRAVRAFVTEQLPLSVKEAVEEADTTADDIRHFVPHQANGQMLDEIQPSLGLVNAASHRTVAEFGNTGSASVPVTLDRANRSGALKDGDQVLLSGFGGGMSIGSAVVRWSR